MTGVCRHFQVHPLYSTPLVVYEPLHSQTCSGCTSVQPLPELFARQKVQTNRLHTSDWMCWCLFLQPQLVAGVLSCSTFSGCFCSFLFQRGTSCFGCLWWSWFILMPWIIQLVEHVRSFFLGFFPQSPSQTWLSSLCRGSWKLHRATSWVLEFPFAAGATMTAVGVVFLMDVRWMWEVLCM